MELVSVLIKGGFLLGVIYLIYCVNIVLTQQKVQLKKLETINEDHKIIDEKFRELVRRKGLRTKEGLTLQEKVDNINKLSDLYGDFYKLYVKTGGDIKAVNEELNKK